MSPFLIWTICYAIPVLSIIRFKAREQNSFVRTIWVHLLLVVIIGLFALFGVFFHWTFSLYSMIALVLSVSVAALIIGRLGVAYLPSCFIQEWVLLLAGPLLATELPFFIALILTAFPFALAHKDNKKTWKEWSVMFIPYLLWAITSLCLYEWLHQPLYNVALHLFAGTVLVYFGVLFKNRHEEVPWLMPH